MYLFFSLRDMPTVNLFWGEQFKPGHLSLVSWKKSLVVKMPCCFERMEKALIKTVAFMIFIYRVMCELKMLTITCDNVTLFFLQWDNKGFHKIKYDYLEHIYLIKILNSNEFSEA